MSSLRYGFLFGYQTDGSPPAVLEIINFTPSGPGLVPTSWLQASWYVDPQNTTGTASDSNDGATPTTAVISYNGGIAAKWGTYSPILRQNTTITWLSSQLTADDPVILTPIMAAPLGTPLATLASVGAVLSIVGVLGTAQLVGSGVLAGVIAKNRVTGQLLTATTPSQALDLKPRLIQNTTVGKSSFAWTTIAVGGGAPVFTADALTQPLAPLAFPLNPNNIFTAVNTWANGDTYNLWEPVQVNVVEVKPTIASYDFSLDFPAQVQFQHIEFVNADAPTNSSVFIDSDVTAVECLFTAFMVDKSADDVLLTGFFNCAFGGGGVSANAGNVFSALWAGFTNFFGVSAYNYDYDVMMQCNAGSILRCAFSDPLVTTTRLGKLYIAGKAIFNGTWDFATGDNSGAQPIIWGPGLLECQGAGTRVFYRAGPGEAALTFLQTGGFHLDDQANANAFNPTSGLFSAPIAISAANLDKSFALGGFGGLAVNMGGASISNQGTP